MTKLEQALAQAVAEENYEAAATFRDMIAEGKTDPPAEHEHNAHSLLGERGIEIFDEFIRQLRTIRKYRRTSERTILKDVIVFFDRQQQLVIMVYKEHTMRAIISNASITYFTE